MIGELIMNAAETSSTIAPFHDGERLIQAHYGVSDHMDKLGRRVIRDYMTGSKMKRTRLLRLAKR